MRRLIEHYKQWNSSEAILSIIGPTASGKTKLALEIAASLKSKPLLVSVDAVAVYKKLDIGSAKPSIQERSDFDWAGLDLIECDQEITAFEFLRSVEISIQSAINHNQPVIFVGGSFFYERILVDGPGRGEPSDKEFLKELENQDPEDIYKQLIEKEPNILNLFSANDRYRLYRYADLILRQKHSLKELRQVNPPFVLPVDTLITGLERKSDEHYELRIQSMFNQGWVDECHFLRQSFSDDSPGLKTIGYKQVVNHINGLYDSEFCKQEIVKAHRQLAKKQRTWLRGLLSGQS